MSPRRLAPISARKTSYSFRSAPSTHRVTPSGVLKDFGVASTRNLEASMAVRMCLAVVLPALPVMPMRMRCGAASSFFRQAAK